MYRCKECGNLFEDGEQTYWTEENGERVNGCPVCSSTYEEVQCCKKCGAYFSEENLYDGFCTDCLKENRYNLDLCLKIGDAEKIPIKINSCLASLFCEQDIETILIEKLKKEKDVDCLEFITHDMSWFSEELQKLKGEL